jgi:hypothetical protein
MKLILEPLSATHTLTCPACQAAVFVAHPADVKVPRGQYWLRDGDVVSPLYQRLTEAQQTPDGTLAQLMVGRCPCCREDYYVGTVSLMNAEFNEVDDYLLNNRDPGPLTNYRCFPGAQRPNVPASWLMHEYRTAAGVMHEHVFGPWRLSDPTGVIGAAGVACCGISASGNPWEHVAAMMHTVWDALRAANREASR